MGHARDHQPCSPAHHQAAGVILTVSRRREAQRRPVHLEAEVFDLMTKWIERYRRQAEERFQRLDALLATLPDDTEGDDQ